MVFTFLSIFLSSALVQAAKFDCTSLLFKPISEQTYLTSPTSDFTERDSLPQTEKPVNEWLTCCGSYGPCALPYPKVVFPISVDRVEWSRTRVVATAKKWIDLPYRHHHIPAMGGLDCSNLTAFVYNFAFGIRFTSWVERQADEVGRKLKRSEPLAPGDLIFLYSADFTRISHALIYISPTEIIDSTGPGVQIRPFAGWYKKNYAWARRVIE